LGIVEGIETHSIRHAVANQLDRLGVGHEVIAKLLNQKDLATTAYYKEPTRHQIIKASELLFVETVDWNVRPAGTIFLYQLRREGS
jgi:site-specific recombinase XerD